MTALHPTDVLVGHQVAGRPLLHHGWVMLARALRLEGKVGADKLQRVISPAGELRPGVEVVAAVEARFCSDQKLLLLLHFGLRRAADCALLGTFEQLAGLGVTEASEGEVGRNAGPGTLGPLVRFLRGPRSRRGRQWRIGTAWTGKPLGPQTAPPSIC